MMNKLDSDNKRKERDLRMDLASEIFDVVEGMYTLYSLTTDDGTDDNRLSVVKIEIIDDLLDLPLHVWMNAVDDASRIEANKDSSYMTDADTVVFIDFETMSAAFDRLVHDEADGVRYSSYHTSHLTESEIHKLNDILLSLTDDNETRVCIEDKAPIPRFNIGCYKARPDVICIIDTAGDHNDKITICPPVSYDADIPEYCGFLKQEYVGLVLQNKLGSLYQSDGNEHVLTIKGNEYRLYKFAANTLDFYDTRGCAHYERKRAMFLAKTAKPSENINVKSDGPEYQGFRF